MKKSGKQTFPRVCPCQSEAITLFLRGLHEILLLQSIEVACCADVESSVSITLTNNVRGGSVPFLIAPDSSQLLSFQPLFHLCPSVYPPLVRKASLG